MTVLCFSFFFSFRAGFGVWNLVIGCYYVLMSIWNIYNPAVRSFLNSAAVNVM
jgi:hypothetical protein